MILSFSFYFVCRYATWAGRENISGSVVGGLMGTDELRRFRSLYEENRETRPLSEAQLALRLHQSKVNALNAQLEEQTKLLGKYLKDYENGSNRLAEMNRVLSEKREENERLAAEIEKFKKMMEESEFAGTVKELQNLVALNETLKTHMAEFEESCKRQAEELRQKVMALRGGEDDDESQYIARVENAHLGMLV
jgi:DNA repair ATPase RecN